MKSEVKVGILFVVVTVLALAVALFLSEYTARLGTYRLVLHFKDVKGLAINADVELSGVRVGKVDTIDLAPSPDYPDRPVRVIVSVKQDVHLFKTDAWVLDQGGLLGDIFISVVRPSEEQLKAAGLARGVQVEPDEDIGGGELMGFAALGDEAQVLADRATQALDKMMDIYASPEMKADIQQFMAAMRLASGQITAITLGAAQLVNSLNQLVAANQGAVGSMIEDAQSALGEIRQGASQVNSLMQGFASGPLPGEIIITMANLRKTSEDLREITASARGMLANEENQKRLDQLLANAVDASANLRKISDSLAAVASDTEIQTDLKTSLTNLREITDNLKTVSEASRQVLANQENLEAINATIKNLAEASRQAVEISHKANSTLDRVDTTMDFLGGAGSALRPRQTTGRFTLEGEEDGRWRGDVNFDLQYGDNPNDFWRVGVRGVGDDGTINLQRSLPLGPSAYARFGLIGSRAGVGLDYRAQPGLLLEAEGWNPRDPRLDLRAIWGVTPELELTAGLNRALDRNDPFIGVQHVIRFNSP